MPLVYLPPRREVLLRRTMGPGSLSPSPVATVVPVRPHAPHHRYRGNQAHRLSCVKCRVPLITTPVTTGTVFANHFAPRRCVSLHQNGA